MPRPVAIFENPDIAIIDKSVQFLMFARLQLILISIVGSSDRRFRGMYCFVAFVLQMAEGMQTRLLLISTPDGPRTGIRPTGALFYRFDL